ncbi:MAG: anti-sigma factor [Solirubrobacterales bacterium]
MSDVIDGELSPRQAIRFARHVDDCPRCGRMLRGLIRMRIVLSSIGQSQPPGPSIVPSVLERLRSEDCGHARACGTREVR